MAKTDEELKGLLDEAAQLSEKLKDLEPDELAKVTAVFEKVLKKAEKSEVSVNFEEDTIPVSRKDIATGLRNY